MKKVLAGALVAMVLAAAGIGFWIYSSLDSMVKVAIEEYVPPMTQTSVKVSAVRLSPADGTGRTKDREPGKKMIVELLSIRDARVSYAPAVLKGKSLDISLPDIELKDIGKDRGGVTGAQLAKAITDALKPRITRSVAGAAKGVGNAAGNALKGVGAGIKGLFGK